jgi:hypothetical protein
MSFNLKTAIATLAPTIASMLGTPLAGAGVAALLGAFGITPTGDQTKDTAAATAFVQSGNMTPEIVAAVRAADQKHLELMGQQGIDLVKIKDDYDAATDKIAADNTDSARKREEVVQDNTPKVLAGLGVILFAALIVFVATGSVTEGMRDGFWMLAGAAVSIVKDIYGYYFGSSKSSHDKDATISEIAKAP